jgi:hypothetical protein
VCVCLHMREKKNKLYIYIYIYCVCVYVRERERERKMVRYSNSTYSIISVGGRYCTFQPSLPHPNLYRPLPKLQGCVVLAYLMVCLLATWLVSLSWTQSSSFARGKAVSHQLGNISCQFFATRGQQGSQKSIATFI